MLLGGGLRLVGEACVPGRFQCSHAFHPAGRRVCTSRSTSQSTTYVLMPAWIACSLHYWLFSWQACAAVRCRLPCAKPLAVSTAARWWEHSDVLAMPVSQMQVGVHQPSHVSDQVPPQTEKRESVNADAQGRPLILLAMHCRHSGVEYLPMRRKLCKPSARAAHRSSHLSHCVHGLLPFLGSSFRGGLGRCRQCPSL